MDRVLITGRLARSLEPELKAHAKATFYCVEEQNLTQAVIDWADAIAAFRLPPLFDYRHIRWVHSFGAGVDQCLPVVIRDEIPVLTRTIGEFGEKIAHYCLHYILADALRDDEYRAHQSQATWIPLSPQPVDGTHALILGTGQIGRDVAAKLSLFGMQVTGVSRRGAKQESFERVVSWNELGNATALGGVDYVINTLPLTVQTKNLLNGKFFMRLQNTMFINVGRGETVVEDDLLHAMDEQWVRRAVLDVFREEPLPAQHPFWRHPRIVVTPHIAAVTSLEEAKWSLLDTLARLHSRSRLNNLVDIHVGY